MPQSTIIVRKYEPTDPRLGRHVEQDNSSRAYAYMAKAVLPKRKTTHWSSQAPVLDQGDVGSCTGNATAQWLNTDFASLVRVNKNGGKFFTEADALSIYARATRYDAIPGSYPPDDTGSTGNAAAKAAKFFGYIVRYSWLFSFQSIQAAIEQTPLSVGTLWTQDMFRPNNGLVKVGKLVDSNIAGGHQYLMDGIDYEEEVFEFKNSWGEQWGKAGHFAIRFKDFITLLDNQADVTVPRIV